jgi:hypothetical protein
MSSFFYRLFGAAVLDAGMYEGIEADTRATWQAGAIVVLSSFAAGIGASGWQGPQPATFLTFSIIALGTWVMWAMLIFQTGGRWFRDKDTQTTRGELLRTIGFAASPGLLQAFAALPNVTVPVFVVSWLWMLAAMVVAVQHALDYRTTGRAVLVCALTAALAFTIAVVLGVAFETTVQ